MSVWLPPTAAEQPDVTLTDWAAFEVLVPELGAPTIHVVGYNATEGRVSSPVVKVDAGQHSVVTSTGRVYRLKGSPGLNGDAQYIWRRWLVIWKASVLSDATAALQSQIAGPVVQDAKVCARAPTDAPEVREAGEPAAVGTAAAARDDDV
jgi:hypothetical protein